MYAERSFLKIKLLVFFYWSCDNHFGPCIDPLILRCWTFLELIKPIRFALSLIFSLQISN